MLVPLWMSANEAAQQRITAPSPPPLESYSHPPDAPFNRSDYVIKINQIDEFVRYSNVLHGLTADFVRAVPEDKWDFAAHQHRIGLATASRVLPATAASRVCARRLQCRDPNVETQS